MPKLSKAPRTTGAALVCATLLAGASLGATEFLRGDTNQDGRVSFADVRASILMQFWGVEVSCLESFDYNDDGKIDIVDTVDALNFATGMGAPPTAPFPEAGADAGGTDLGCDTYEVASPPGDPGAVLHVHDIVVPGGASGRGLARLAYSSTVDLSGFHGRLIDAASVLAFVPGPGEDPFEYGDAVVDLTGMTQGVGVVGIEGELRFTGHLSFVFPNSIGPQEDFTFAEFPVCVNAGTPPGEYPLRIGFAEFSDYSNGYAITPAFIDGTIRVLEEVRGDGCAIEQATYVHYALDAEEAAPGEAISVPLRIRSNASGFSAMYSLRFDPDILEATGVTTSFANPSGNPLMMDYFDIEASGVGGAVMSDRLHTFRDGDRPYDFFPVREDFELVKVHFRVRDTAPGGIETRIHFEAGVAVVPRDVNGICTIDGSHCDTAKRYSNRFANRANFFTPESIDSFVLLDGILKIVGDVTIFRGDANSDDLVDMSDAMFILSYLFLGESKPRCADAADVNDDGEIDISDPVGLLVHLFVRPGAIAPPFPSRGPDPTPDGLGCGSH